VTSQYSNLNENKPTIVIMTPSKLLGGVKVIVAKLIRGLKLEGFNVKPIVYSLKTELIYGLKLVKQLPKFNAIMYVSSIPVLSHLIHSKFTKTILFVHGYTKYQLLELLKYEKLIYKLGAAYLMMLWKVCETARKMHKFICHSLTLCEVNGIKQNYILLPQFMFLDEIKSLETFSKRIRESKRMFEGSNFVKIVTYTSYAKSPKLLNIQDLENLARAISKRVNKVIEFTIICPNVGSYTTKPVENLIIRCIGALPRVKFLEIVANSDLFYRI